MNNKAAFKKVVIGRAQLTKCTECKNETFQRDSICVVCKSGIPQIYKELIDLLKKDKKYKLMKKLKLVEAK